MPGAHFDANEFVRSLLRAPLVSYRTRGLQWPHVAVTDPTTNDFGVSVEQVRRDHAISHVLSALSPLDVADSIIFFGGTALSRTLLPRLRLSEDIEVISRTADAPSPK